MSDHTLLEVMAAVATQLDTQLSSYVPGIQIEPGIVKNPTPPCIDIYPGDPFGEQTAFKDSSEETFTVRARVSGVDHWAGQQLLIGLMDRHNGSVVNALQADRTIGGTVDNSRVEGPSGYTDYIDASGVAGNLLGAEWRLVVVR